jgi:hypothetical protein
MSNKEIFQASEQCRAFCCSCPESLRIDPPMRVHLLSGTFRRQPFPNPNNSGMIEYINNYILLLNMEQYICHY